MNLIENIISYLRNSRSETEGTAPEGVCPNCWGRQEYAGTIRDLYEDKQIDVNNHKAQYAFVQEFIVNRIKGITLIKGTNSYECPTCRTSVGIEN